MSISSLWSSLSASTDRNGSTVSPSVVAQSHSHTPAVPVVETSETTAFPNADELVEIMSHSEVRSSQQQLQNQIFSTCQIVQSKVSEDLSTLEDYQRSLDARIGKVDALAYKTLSSTNSTIFHWSRESLGLSKVEDMAQTVEKVYSKLDQVLEIVQQIDSMIAKMENTGQNKLLQKEEYPHFRRILRERDNSGDAMEATLSMTEGRSDVLDAPVWGTKVLPSRGRRHHSINAGAPAPPIRTILPQPKRRVSASAVPLRELDSASTTTSVATGRSRFSFLQSWGRKNTTSPSAEEKLRHIVRLRSG